MAGWLCQTGRCHGGRIQYEQNTFFHHFHLLKENMAGAHRVISDQFQALVHINSFLVSPFHQQSFLKGGSSHTGSDETCTNRVWVWGEGNVAERRQSAGFISWKLRLRFTHLTAGFIDLRFFLWCQVCFVRSVLSRQGISTTTPAVRDVAGAIRCSQKEKRCICKVSTPASVVTVTGNFIA